MEGENQEQFNKLAENPEQQELNPEIIEKIMEKVQDINETGTAFVGYTGWGNGAVDRIESAMQKGIIPKLWMEKDRRMDLFKKTGWDDESTREKIYAYLLKKKIHPPVFFNIMGRSRWAHHAQEAIKNMYDNKDYGGRWQDSVTILFDLSKYKEVAPPISQSYIDHIDSGQPIIKTSERINSEAEGILYGPGSDTANIPLGSYIADTRDFYYGDLIKELLRIGIKDEKNIKEALTPGSDFLKLVGGRQKKDWHPDYECRINEDGQPMPTCEYGFTLKGRIKPRTFTGIVIRVSRPETDEEMHEREKHEFEHWPKNKRERTREEDPQKYIERAKIIAQSQIKINPDKPELYVPIYDLDGNLLWPKQMSYEEVKKMVEEKKPSAVSRQPSDKKGV